MLLLTAMTISIFGLVPQDGLILGIELLVLGLAGVAAAGMFQTVGWRSVDPQFKAPPAGPGGTRTAGRPLLCCGRHDAGPPCRWGPVLGRARPGPEHRRVGAQRMGAARGDTSLRSEAAQSPAWPRPQESVRDRHVVVLERVLVGAVTCPSRPDCPPRPAQGLAPDFCIDCTFAALEARRGVTYIFAYGRTPR